MTENSYNIPIPRKFPRGLPIRIFLLVFIVFIAVGNLCCQALLPDSITALMIRYKNAGDDSARVVYLSRLAFFYNDYLGDNEKVDSLAEAAIRVAEGSKRRGLMILAYNNYLESTDAENNIFYHKAVGYGNKALQSSRIINNLALHWLTCRNLAQIYLSKHNFEKALSASNEAMIIANSLKNNRMIVESYLCIGGSLEGKNQKIEAFKNYLIAGDMAEKINDSGLLKKCYAQLFRFYNENKLFDDAIECKQKEIEIILSIKPVDTTSLMWANLYLQLIDVRKNKSDFNQQNVKNIIDFAIRTKNVRLKAGEFALYRQYLIKSDQIMTLYKFYNKTYPGEFENIYLHDPEMYFRVKAYFKELEELPDSSDFYFRKAQQLIINNNEKGKIYQANFFNRYGQFLMRQRRSREAIEKFTRAYNLCEGDILFGRYEYMLTASNNLEKLYRENGDYKNAWFYASANMRISDSISIISKKDQLMAEAVRRERSKKEIAAEQDRQKIRQGKNQRNMMAGGVVFFIIVSLLAYRNYRNQKRLNGLLDEAKKQSDHLLLNILPQETAEELKSTGKASAKRFDEVTVMFTDFKDFTQASERMTAEELVDEMNFYFSEFDNIISRHNIEKIKIIGDSYMCAGGLPAANDTHAHDVVQAAVELQEFMIAQKAERSGLGKSFFELRIGIHTGPVVAGIVGLKKFAYDIWGDTVNTASRMENTGEPNKINISGNTYEKVKDRFKCTYRGKVAAKHKGEIDMYFVVTGND
jgi:class 3 adenylate cyclase